MCIYIYIYIHIYTYIYMYAYMHSITITRTKPQSNKINGTLQSKQSTTYWLSQDDLRREIRRESPRSESRF